MSPYVFALRTAFVTFPFIALLMTMPYMLYQYHKYGAMLVYRVIVVYTFWFYVLCMCFLVSLPLPSFEEAAAIQDNMIRLVPFQFLTDIRHEADIAVAGLNWETLKAVLKTTTFFEAAANIVMMVPFGIYLHYYFEKSWWKVVFWGFAMSLFFEVSQITALFGIYPHPYRYFDVDDLICNTSGAFAGCVITPLLTFFLPSKERLNKISYHKGHRVSFIRRAVGTLVDIGVVTAIVFSVFQVMQNHLEFMTGIETRYRKAVIMYVIYIGVVLIYFVLIPTLTNGRTPGKVLVNIRLKNSRGRRIGFLQMFVRHVFLYYVVLPAPLYALVSYVMMIRYYTGGFGYAACMWAMILFMSILVLYLCNVLVVSLTGSHKTICDRFAGTEYVSTIHEEEYDEDSAGEAAEDSDENDFYQD